MKILLIVLWLALGASYFFFLQMGKERCCQSGKHPGEDLIGNQMPIEDANVKRDSMIHLQVPHSNEPLWNAARIW